MQSSWKILEKKAKKTGCCAEASEARDQEMAETEPKTGRLSGTLTMTTPFHVSLPTTPLSPAKAIFSWIHRGLRDGGWN